MVQFVIAPPKKKKKIHFIFGFSPILKSSRKYWIIAQQNQAPTLGPGQDSHNQLLFSLQWPGLGSLASASVFFSVTQARFLQSLLLIFSLQSFRLISFTCYSCFWKIFSLFLFWLLSVNLKQWFFEITG